ncbi:MAG: hypothetical protein ABEJ83_01385 [Candidatus Nanohaloarchaea archaeon]
MGVVTVSIDDSVEERFREKLEELGNPKGAMGDAVSEALENWLQQKDREKREWQEIMEEGIELGEIDFERENLHER